MAKGYFELQGKRFGEIIAFSPLFYQKWIWVVLKQGKRKFLFVQGLYYFAKRNETKRNEIR